MPYFEFCCFFLQLFFPTFQVFFILRKKYNQITFLHTYHHAGMVAATYIFTKFLAGIYVVMVNQSQPFKVNGILKIKYT